MQLNIIEDNGDGFKDVLHSKGSDKESEPKRVKESWKKRLILKKLLNSKNKNQAFSLNNNSLKPQRENQYPEKGTNDFKRKYREENSEKNETLQTNRARKKLAVGHAENKAQIKSHDNVFHKVSSLFSKNDYRMKTSLIESKEKVPTLVPNTSILDSLYLPSITNFEQVGLCSNLCTTLSRMNICRPAHIQSISLSSLIPENLKYTPNITTLPKLSLSDYQKELIGNKSRPDILIQSSTGSGKSLSYLLPILHILLSLKNENTNDSKNYFSVEGEKMKRVLGTFVIIVTPTRELSIQLNDLIVKLLSFPKTSMISDDADSSRWIVPGTFLTGISRSKEKARLRAGLNVLISTPGRLLDHLENTKHWKLDHLGFIILEEADRFLEPSLSESFNKIANQINSRLTGQHRQWQLVLVSATFPSDLSAIGNVELKSPVLLKTLKEENKLKEKEPSSKMKQELSKANIPTQLVQHFVLTPTKLRLVTLLSALRALSYEGGLNEIVKIVLFLSTCDSVDFFFRLLGQLFATITTTKKAKTPTSEELQHEETLGFVYSSFLNGHVYRLHGKRESKHREEVIKLFNATSHSGSPEEGKMKLKLLITTNIAARGLDFPNVKYILQYDPPFDALDYIHRVGRTARFQNEGMSLLFLLEHEKDPLLDALKLALDQGSSSSFVKEISMESYWKHWNENSHRQSLLRSSKSRTPDSLLFDAKKVDYDAGSASSSNNGIKDKDIEISLSALQNLVEESLTKDLRLLKAAKNAYIASVRAYTTYPLQLRERGLTHKNLHLGHYAKSFGLREPPSIISNHINAEPKVNKKARKLKTTPMSNSSQRGLGASQILALAKENNKRPFKPQINLLSEFNAGDAFMLKALPRKK